MHQQGLVFFKFNINSVLGNTFPSGYYCFFGEDSNGWFVHGTENLEKKVRKAKIEQFLTMKQLREKLSRGKHVVYAMKHLVKKTQKRNLCQVTGKDRGAAFEASKLKANITQSVFLPVLPRSLSNFGTCFLFETLMKKEDLQNSLESFKQRMKHLNLFTIFLRLKHSSKVLDSSLNIQADHLKQRIFSLKKLFRSFTNKFAYPYLFLNKT